MAPIPEENKDNKTPDRDGGEIGHFSNPNLANTLDAADSSDDDDLTSTAGYSLLPQEPGEEDDSDSSDTEDSSRNEAGYRSDDQAPVNTSITSDAVPNSVLASEAGASAPTIFASAEHCHSAFLAKYPDGKVPSYMHIPHLPRDKDGLLWNQQREDSTTFDKANDSAILKAMSGFSLPTENIPEWAKAMSEEQWKRQVLAHIGKTDRTDDEKEDASASAEHNCDKDIASREDCTK